MQRSYIVNVSRVETSPSPDYAGSVFVASSGNAAGFTDERSFPQGKRELVSRSATRAGHSGVSRVNEEALTLRGFGLGKQNPFCHSNRTIGGFLGHRGFSEESGLEVLDSNLAEINNNSFCPFVGAVFSLSGNLQMDARNAQFSNRATPRAGHCPRQFPVRFLQFFCAVFDLIAAWKIEFRCGRGGDFAHTPVDANGRITRRKGLALSPDHKGHIPMAIGLSADDAGTWNTGQPPTPNHRNRDATNQTKPTFLNSKTVFNVFHRRPGRFAILELREAFLRLSERLLMRLCPLADGLLLNALRVFSQPFKLRSPACELLCHPAPCRRLMFNAFFICFVGCVTRLHALIPDPSGAVPFPFQAGQRNNARSQTVVVSDNGLVLAHG